MTNKDHRAPTATPTSNCSLGRWRVRQARMTTTSVKAKPRRRCRTAPPPAKPDDDTRRHGTHPHAYEQLMGAVCYGGGCERGARDYRRTTRHPPHAYEFLFVGWIVEGTDDREVGTRAQETSVTSPGLQFFYCILLLFCATNNTDRSRPRRRRPRGWLEAAREMTSPPTTAASPCSQGGWAVF
jgi:hypothetical protein